MPYSYFERHRLTVTRPGGETVDGIWQEDGEETVYAGRADVQTNTALTRAKGAGYEKGDYTAFLPTDVRDVEPGDEAVIEHPDGSLEEATVTEVHPVDDSLTLERA